MDNFKPITVDINGKTFYKVPLENFSGYAVSEYGVVMSSRNPKGEWIEKKPTYDKNTKYFNVTLTKDTWTNKKHRQKTFTLHRLLYISIISGPLDRYSVIDHIDNDKNNNKLENLQILSLCDNIRKDNSGENHFGSKLTNIQAKAIWNDICNKKAKKLTFKEIANIYSVSIETVYHIAYGNTWNCVTGLPYTQKPSKYKHKEKQISKWNISQHAKTFEIFFDRAFTHYKQEQEKENKKQLKINIKQAKIEQHKKEKSFKHILKISEPFEIYFDKHFKSYSPDKTKIEWCEAKRIISNTCNISLNEAKDYIVKLVNENKISVYKDFFTRKVFKEDIEEYALKYSA